MGAVQTREPLNPRGGTTQEGPPRRRRESRGAAEQGGADAGVSGRRRRAFPPRQSVGATDTGRDDDGGGGATIPAGAVPVIRSRSSFFFSCLLFPTGAPAPRLALVAKRPHCGRADRGGTPSTAPGSRRNWEFDGDAWWWGRRRARPPSARTDNFESFGRDMDPSAVEVWNSRTGAEGFRGPWAAGMRRGGGATRAPAYALANNSSPMTIAERKVCIAIALV